MSEPTTSLRDAIASAIEEPEQATTPAPEAAPAPVQAPLDLEPQAAAEPAAEASAEAEPAADLNEISEAEQPDNEQAQQQARDDQGKFKKTDGMVPGPKPGPKPQGERPPASWKPEIREHWGSLPEPVRAEIARREVEVQRTLQETAEARKTAESIDRVISPYMSFIKAEGSNPLQAIDNMMSTAAKLRTGTAPELATMMAQLINQFGTGRFGNAFIEQLDGALAGQAPRVDPQQAAIEQVLNQRLAPVQQMLTQFQQAQVYQQQQVAERAQNEVAQFISQAEFGDDVREDMADLLEAAQRKGQSLTLQQAYEKACYLNDSVRKVMQQRQAAQGASVTTQAAQRAKAAAVSVSGGAPLGALKQEPTDVRAAIEAAISMSSR
jgi:hypothetical protein